MKNKTLPLLLLLSLLLGALLFVGCNNAHIHDFSGDTVERVEPTCTEEGYAVIRCKTCEETERVVLPAAHDYQVTETIGDAERRVCSRCEDLHIALPEGGMILERLGAAKGRYASFNVYLPASDPSGNYFIRYKFQYEYSDVRNNYASNTTTNVSNIRIKTAQLVLLKDLTAEKLTVESKRELLGWGGEISLAFGEKNATDFIGGYHGDEWLSSVTLSADGNPIDLYEAKSALFVCREIKFDEDTTLYRWGTSDADSHGEAVAEHHQKFTITSDGIRDRQNVVWLVDDFNINLAYMQMYTMARKDGKNPVCDTFEIFDGDGNSLYKETVKGPVDSAYDSPKKAAYRLVKYSGTAGFSGEAGFTIVDDSTAPDQPYVMIRADNHNDNKWYAAFKSTNGSKTPAIGESWTVDLIYRLDYATPY